MTRKEICEYIAAHMRENILLYIKEPDRCGYYIKFCEGTGDNLLREDYDEGFVDYIYYEIFHLNAEEITPEFEEYDGGMILLKEYYVDLLPGEILYKILEFEGISNRAELCILV